MQRITLIGNVGQDATIKQHLGSEFITFSVAVNEKFTNREGVEVENTQWYSCLYQPKAMTVAKYLKKGTRVFVEGKPKVSIYDDKNGQPKVDFGVQVRGIELLSTVAVENSVSDNAKPTEQTASNSVPDSPKPTAKTKSKPETNVPAETGDDDLPF